MNDLNKYEKVALALHYYLLGEITDNIFAITFGCTGSQTDVVFYTYCDPALDELDSLGAIAAELLSEMTPDITDVELFFVPIHKRSPVKLAEWLFLRKDPKVIRQIPLQQPSTLRPHEDFSEFSERAWLSKYESGD